MMLSPGRNQRKGPKYRWHVHRPQWLAVLLGHRWPRAGDVIFCGVLSAYARLCQTRTTTAVEAAVPECDSVTASRHLLAVLKPKTLQMYMSMISSICQFTMSGRCEYGTGFILFVCTAGASK
ncbi:hypothetical protein CEXT_25761 [Caerostris extrusa]|uniref:Uncharacterized protein n=1 Tax=Caerostris extrusa TaxID=172846 RepID=A0AAV4TS39_CAEEX|nr:hypothetical protein CEXT_25761 [Caerostris extrusa]